jgi:hypothetical protein
VYNCPKILRELIKRGACYNQKDSSGATPSYYAFNSKLGKEAWRVLPYTAEYEYPTPVKEEPAWEIINIINNPIPVWHHVNHDLLIDGQAIELIANTHVPPKPKKLKSKLYKQQFGPRGKKR